MIKKVGRLSFNEIKEIEIAVEKTYKKIKAKDKKKAEKLISDISKNPNYFVREKIGELMAEFEDRDIFFPLMDKCLKNKTYGVRAAALIFYANVYSKEPFKMIKIINGVYHKIPWETENIITNLWQKFPNEMKIGMQEWVKSDDIKKKLLAFQGIENVGTKDPNFVMEFLDDTIDEDDLNVQKKITHILTQIARERPAEVYPYIREWLSQGTESRTKTLWVSMKKLSNIIAQRYRKNVSSDFVSLTEQTILDWKNDPNEIVAKFGGKLQKIISKH
ncbi:MAG: DNA alkylation repair protein [Candidatus Cloacimonadota bacterium]|nr:DNA alkylation repair protein [Candidatus Cloacimonadota bacterium]